MHYTIRFGIFKFFENFYSLIIWLQKKFSRPRLIRALVRLKIRKFFEKTNYTV